MLRIVVIPFQRHQAECELKLDPSRLETPEIMKRLGLELTNEEGRFVVKTLAPEGFLLNGTAAEEAMLEDGDSISTKDHLLLVVASVPKASVRVECDAKARTVKLAPDFSSRESQEQEPPEPRVSSGLATSTRTVLTNLKIPGERLPRPFGPYYLLRCLGAGNIARVYEALNPAKMRLEALKILAATHPEREIAERFIQEGLAMKRMDHPHIIRCHDAGEWEGALFISMDIVEGPTLDRAVRMGSVPLYSGVLLLWKIALTVDYIHRHNVVHRDLKPGNIMLDANDQPIVMDFGTAKDILRRGLTTTNEIIGTPGYMSPEQARGQMGKVDERADVFALGGILYFLLTGQLPFRAPNLFATLDNVLNHPPEPPEGFFASSPSVEAERLRAQYGQCPAHAPDAGELMTIVPTYRELASIAEKAVQKDPKDRYPNAALMAVALEKVLDRIGMPMTP